MTRAIRGAIVRRLGVRARGGAIALAALALLASPQVSLAGPDGGDESPPQAADQGPKQQEDPRGRDLPPADASLRLDPRREVTGGGIPKHFVGFSIEWSLIERYMAPTARPGFAGLLTNLGTGVLRIGGGSQDLMPFDAAASNTNHVITPDDLAAIRATLDAANADDTASDAPSWGAILGTAMAPRTDARPWVGPDHARAFTTHGVVPAFSGGAARDVAGIELGNEPDLSYRSDAGAYLKDFDSFSNARVTDPFTIVAPNTSETIAPWSSIDARTVPTRFFWNWPPILDATAPVMTASAAAFGAFATDHFYPMSRSCSTDPYRCSTIPRLLSDERMSNFDYEVYTHASEAARHNLGYRVEELNSASGRGVQGVSNVAASAVWALDTMFNAACPQPPNAPTANADCGTGAIGVNFHNAEVERFFEGPSAWYNAIDYDPSPATAAPTAAPEYYAVLLFARFAQGTSGLRPVAVTADPTAGAQVKAWRVDADASERRLFLINKGDRPVTLTVSAPGSSFELDRMTPYDPTGADRTLDAPAVRIDGREVSPNGNWAGFQPAAGGITAGRFQITLGAAEAAVISLHGHEE